MAVDDCSPGALAARLLAAGCLLIAACGDASEPSVTTDPGTTPDASVPETAAPEDRGEPSGTLAAFCQAVGDTGCCAGSRVVWCEGGGAVAIECASHGCGWDSAGGFYNCYSSGGDPSGDHPRACPGADEGACVPSCSGRCGLDDGCGGTCRCSDLLSQSCQGGICAKAGSPSACERIAHVGCCEGDTRRHCNAGELETESCANGCGWSEGWYQCGGAGEDPSGAWPLACP